MTLWLKQRLGILVGASLLCGALVWNSGALRAQSVGGADVNIPRVKLTRDQAARNFVLLLQEDKTLGRGFFGNPAPDYAVFSSISPRSAREIGNGLETFLAEMIEQWKRPQLNIRVQTETANTATVTVETGAPSQSRPLILVQENGSWGVDVYETYAQWNGIDSAAKSETIARFTAAYNDSRESARRASCQSNLKQIALGIQQYVQDYDEKYPPAKKWMDVLPPYTGRSEQLFQCPSQATEGFGYAFNSHLSQKSPARFPDLTTTVFAYDSTDSKRNAYGTGENLAFRHQNGANYAFADGHVKWFAKAQTPSFKLKP